MGDRTEPVAGSSMCMSSAPTMKNMITRKSPAATKVHVAQAAPGSVRSSSLIEPIPTSEQTRPTSTVIMGVPRLPPCSLPRGRGRADRVGRHHRTDIGLEDIGSHPGHVPHVVAHVVRDRRRVAGIVLGDAGFDLPDQVGADVGGLGEDAAAHAREEGIEGPPWRSPR